MSKSIFDNLDENEMEVLLKGVNPDDYKVDPEVADRIQKKFKLETGVGKRSGIKMRKGIIAACAAVLLMVTMYQIPVVQATVNKLFSFIPGIGAIENNNEVNSSLLVGKLEKAEDPQNRLLSYAYAVSDGKSIEFRLRIKEDNSKAGELSISEMSSLKLYINDINSGVIPTGSISKSDSETFYIPSFGVKINSGDKIELKSTKYDFSLKGEMEKAEITNPKDLPFAANDGIAIFATAMKAKAGWEISLYSISETVDPVSFVMDIPGEGKGYKFETKNGDYTAELPTSWGSSYRPPLTLSVPDEVKEGILIVPYAEYQTKDKTKVTVEVPEAGKTLETNVKVSLGESSVTITKTYIDPNQNNSPALDFKVSNGEHSLTEFNLVFKEGYGKTFNNETGEGTIYLTDRKNKTGNMTFEIGNPVFRINKEFRIKLELK